MTQQVTIATSEQKRGGDLVVKSTENISSISRENLAAVEQMAKSSEELVDIAEQLQYSVSSFRIHNDENRRCWDIMKCADAVRQKCPAYTSNDNRCWLISGTWCKGVQQGDVRLKLRNCMACKAFKVLSGS
ncbi:MAG TPA: methyl-accepting chemotaxis protein, partial [Nitrospirota bacterium]|nr:methyl-accepting chemotaxis protein [Nitrospirota bacterium]